MKRNLLLLALSLALVLPSCKTSSVSTNVLVPAEINVPQHIQTVGVLNRSLPAKGEGWQNFLEGFLSGESIAADREGSYNVCKGLSFKVNTNPRFKAILMDGEDLRGTGTKEFPVPLAWDEVDRLCNKYKVDAIVSLETFDSDISLRKNSREVERTVNGEARIVTEYLADLHIRVNAGWRIYDNVTKKIIDQNVFYDEKAWDGVGPNPDAALRDLPSKRSAINDAGYFSGEMMGVRISPNWVRVSRYYYTKGDDRFKRAKAFVKVNNWNGAVKIWSDVAKSSDPKAAGRACHNMALAAEMEGDLNIALEWAERAYSSFGIKKERTYINELNLRKMEAERLKEQLPDN
jgi:hypothetical protein